MATPDRRELLTELTRDGFWFGVTFCAEENGLIRCLTAFRTGSESAASACPGCHVAYWIQPSLSMLSCGHK